MCVPKCICLSSFLITPTETTSHQQKCSSTTSNYMPSDISHPGLEIKELVNTTGRGISAWKTQENTIPSVCPFPHKGEREAIEITALQRGI